MTDPEHWEKEQDGRYTELVGMKVRGWTYQQGVGVFIITGHHECGFHLKAVEGEERKCISERAIDRTYHVVRERSAPPGSLVTDKPCPRCGETYTTPTGDGNMLGLCGHMWPEEKSVG